MVSFAETIGLATVSTLFPLLAGITLGYLLRGSNGSVRLPILTAIAAGIIAWFFVDVTADSGFIGLNQGFSGGLSHILIVLLFPAGFLVLMALDRRSQPISPIGAVYLAALAIGFHGLAEGIAVGSTLAPAVDTFDAIGGAAAAASFVIHKLLEAFTISVFLTNQKPLAKIFTAMLVAGVPTILGSAVGFGYSPDASFFFALGAGAALWLLAQLIQRSMSVTNRTVWANSLLAGVLLMYLAGLLHSS